MKLKLFFTIITIVFLSACSTREKIEANIENPAGLYQLAKVLAEDEDYIEASEILNDLRVRFPQSRYAAESELLLAGIEFDQENYLEAAALYGVFVELYPRHKKADMALYRQAESFFRNTPERVARDQASAVKAGQAAKQLIKKYPRSQYRSKARNILAKSRFRLAQKEAYIARWYEKKDKNSAARKRWKTLLEKYSDLKNAKDPEMDTLLQTAQERVRSLK